MNVMFSLSNKYMVLVSKQQSVLRAICVCLGPVSKVYRNAESAKTLTR
jgi:hypothetical protein